MKIICKNQKEYDEVLKACEMIHDFTVCLDRLTPAERKKLRIMDTWNKGENKTFSQYYKEELARDKAEGFGTNIKVEDISGICFPFDKNEVLGLMAALHDCEDKSVRKDWISIEESNNKELVFSKNS